ncbi:hypothetical protein EV127DRAFT_163015 [Xylaria flabelliformis]|nr:hypothetical protein EV127DRAFT_163015 [Xylaria flabelliformis]
MTDANTPKTPSIHSSDAMRKNRNSKIEIDLNEEKSILINLRRMVHTVANLPKEETILRLPYKNATCSISIANLCELNPLPKETVDEMFEEQALLHPRILSTPTKDSPIWWAHPVTKACCALTRARDNSRDGSKKEIKCAGFSQATYYPMCLMQKLLLAGQRNPLWWQATALLFSPTRRYGSIIVTYQVKQEVAENEILRSEVLALLSLLEVAGIREIENQNSCKYRSVLLLSFIRTKVRVIEACLCAPYGIQVSIRQVIDKIPTSNDRDAKFKELVAWTMFVEGGTKSRNPSGSSNRSIASATSAGTTKSCFDDSCDSSSDESSRESSPDASFVGKYDEVNK